MRQEEKENLLLIISSNGYHCSLDTSNCIDCPLDKNRICMPDKPAWTNKEWADFKYKQAVNLFIQQYGTEEIIPWLL